ncbi:MAG: DUF2061 domain-containing protein [Candidatus Geothermarchaeales archaeon]
MSVKELKRRRTKDSRRRSLLKTLTWRLLGSATILIVSLIFTGDIFKAGLIALTAMEIKVALYYVHERLWERVGWGRHEN